VPGGSWDVAITPGGDVLVGGFYDDQLTTLDPATGALRDSVSTAMWPYDVAVDRSAGRGYTAGLDVGRVDVIDFADLSVARELAVPMRPIRVALNVAGSRLYATTLSDLSLVALDTESGLVLPGALNILGIGNGLAMTPDGTTLWVTTTNGHVHLVDPVSLTIRATSTPGGVPQDVVIDAAGQRAYVAHEDGGISVFDAASGARLDFISAPTPFGLALQPGANRLWVASARGGLVYVIDLTTGRIAGGVGVGGRPRTIVFDASGRAFVANESGMVHLFTPDP
jgi:DNA-binding beta-propeller fold protein YncE